MNAASSFAPALISSRTRAIAVIGHPIEHSITPLIQNAALHEAGADIVNVAFNVGPDDLLQAVQGAKSLGFLGLMVTIPHKEAVLSACDELDLSAQSMGAANLLHFRPDGKIVGHSTDGWAALKSLAEEGVGVRGARVTIIGGGGAARSLALTFARAGARAILILNRTVERAQRIADEVLALQVSQLVCRALPLCEETLGEALSETDLLVNASSVGMHPDDDDSPVPAHLLHSDLAVYDIVYNPLETRLLHDARTRGATIVDGLGMLIYTNVRAVEICAGVKISPLVMREEALNALTNK